jgi:threonine synthase
VIIVPPGVNEDRKTAMQIYGSEVIELAGNIEECLHVVRRLVRERGWYETTTYKRANPYTSEGPKTIAFEIRQQLPDVPDAVLVPVGGGGTIGAIWRGFREMRERGVTDRLPRLIGVQNRLFNGLEIAFRQGFRTDAEFRAIQGIDSSLPTVTGPLRHSYLPDGVEAVQAIRDTGGTVVTVTEEEAMEAQRIIASHDGLFVEPSSAVTFAAARKMAASGEFSAESKVVRVLTGSGYREMASTARFNARAVRQMDAEQCLRYLS